MALSHARSVQLVLVLIIAAMGAAAATFFMLSHGSSFEQHPERIWILLLLDVALLGGISAMIASRIAGFWQQARRGIQESRLQRRIVRSFCIVAALPTVVVSIFSALFFNLGIQAWFNERVGTAVQESLVVAEAYLAEHRENIRVDALALADDISRFADMSFANPVEFNRFVSAQAKRRHMTEVVVFQKNRIIAQGRLSFTIAFESLPQSALARAAEGEVVILPSASPEDEDKVRVLTRLEGISDGYLLVGRLVDEKVINHMESTQGAVAEYKGLENQLTRLQWTFSAVFILLSLVLLLAAVWYGLMFAARLTAPISRLSVAAERVRGGDYLARVEAGGGNDEISTLSHTFNRMTEQLDAQRSDLIEANRQLDERRRFSEAVLGGVSAGVLALDREKRITLSNRSAATMLGEGGALMQGRHVNEMLPGINELLAQNESNPDAHGSITLGSGADARSLHVRITAGPDGSIVTFDDITALVSAQRHAAWSDVARRVAHEIKNPLTPIALSAERLKRKFLQKLEGEEAESFTKYVDTIARHVTDIGGMVEEFVSFARMPGAVMQPADLVDLVKHAVFSAQVAYPNVRYVLNCEDARIGLLCDERQVAQIFTNLLKNGAEAIEGESMQAGEVSVTVVKTPERVTVEITDNGPGFPPDKIQSMLEPYVTTRARGTGLGLAIVKKIMEEHGGKVDLANQETGGARVVLSFLQQCDI